MTVLYISGSGRSGSTLLERALGAVPDHANVGELIDLCRRVAPLNERCGCGRPFAECEFWSRVGRGRFGDWDPAVLERMHTLQKRVARQRHLPRLLARGLAGPRFRADLDEYAALYQDLYDAIGAAAGAGIVVDASKWPSQAAALAAGGLDVRVIHLYRDPRGVAYSQSRSDISRPHATQGTDLMNSVAPTEASLRWTATQWESGLLSRLDAPVVRLAYEEFVDDPRGALRTTLTGLGLPVTDADLAFADGRTLELGTSHGLSGNPSRFQEGAVHLAPDTKWRSGLPARDRRVVTALTAPTRAVLDRRRPRTAPAVATQPRSLPLVSVVLPTHGRPDLVRASIEAVVEQSYAGDLECVVVHDREDVDPSLAALGRPGREVRAIGNERTPGLAGARNTGIRQIRGTVVASCDDDDVWHRTKLERQVALLLDQPDLLVAGSGIRLILPDDRIRLWPGRSERVSRRALLRNRVKELHSSTLVMRRDAFAKVGDYDEGLPGGYAEDYDWILRASRVGRIGVVKEPLADISKVGQSYYTGRAENAVVALEAFLAKHPEIETERRGHARILGQIAFNRAAAGDRRGALRDAARAWRRWPLSPYPVLVLPLLVGLGPDRIRDIVRAVTGKGIA